LYGWGRKTAARVLGRYGRLESIPRDAADWDIQVRGVGRLVETLHSAWDEVLLYRTLTTLRTDVELAETLGDLEWKGARRDEMRALCKELGDTGVLRRVPRWRS
jgi:hypothetical protein